MNRHYYCFPHRVNYIYTTQYMVMQVTLGRDEYDVTLDVVAQLDRIDSAIKFMDNLPAAEAHRCVLYSWSPACNQYVITPLYRIVAD